MKKCGMFGIVCALLLAQPVFAALPPLYQSLAEIKAIVNSNEMGNTFPSSQVVRSIHKEEDGSYLILTDQMQVKVEIQYLPSAHPGPLKFRLIFGEPESLKQ